MSPKISVIIPIYNVENYIRRCLDSVLAQDFGDMEIILVDDGSTDSSGEICDEYAGNDARIKVIHKENGGLSSARNAGTDIAVGQYISFIDSDDYILPGMYANLCEKADMDGTDILSFSAYKLPYTKFDGSIYWVRNSDVVMRRTEASRRDLLFKGAVNLRNSVAWNKLYRLDFLKENNIMFLPAVYSEDSIFNVQCFFKAKAVGFLSEAYYVYCERKGSIINSLDTNSITKSNRILWNTYLDNARAETQIDEILAFAAARLISATFSKMKASHFALENICEYVQWTINELGLMEHLNNALSPKLYNEYAKISCMNKSESESFYEFIESLVGGYEAILARQTRYLKTEKM